MTGNLILLVSFNLLFFLSRFYSLPIPWSFLPFFLPFPPSCCLSFFFLPSILPLFLYPLIYHTFPLYPSSHTFSYLNSLPCLPASFISSLPSPTHLLPSPSHLTLPYLPYTCLTTCPSHLPFIPHTSVTIYPSFLFLLLYILVTLYPTLSPPLSPFPSLSPHSTFTPLPTHHSMERYTGIGTPAVQQASGWNRLVLERWENMASYIFLVG